MLDAVYIYNEHAKSIVAVKPKLPFKPVFQIAASRKGSYIRIINEPLVGLSLFLVETGERACFRSKMVSFGTKNGLALSRVIF
jgi:hypothetical protein